MLNLTNDGINEFTIDCDKFLIDTLRECNMYTYLWDMGAVRWDGDVGYIAIRVPGATRGCIAVDKAYTITDVVFYDDVCFGQIGCYEHGISEYIKGKYIGSTFNPESVLCKTSTNYKALQNKLSERSTGDVRA